MRRMTRVFTDFNMRMRVQVMRHGRIHENGAETGNG
jgi:hypothetical protein